MDEETGQRADAKLKPAEDLWSPDELAALEAAFDRAFYEARNPDVQASEMDSLHHFLVHGWCEGRDPSPDFSMEWYLSQSPDLRGTGQNPFAHWVLHGREEGRLGLNPSRFTTARAFAMEGLGLSEAEFACIETGFDSAHYLARNSDVAKQGLDPLHHFLVHGWREGRNPSPDFDIAHYLENNPDIAKSHWNPFVHWILHGREEGRGAAPAAPPPGLPDPESIDWTSAPQSEIDDISELFDAEYYLSAYPEVAALGVDPRAHYLLAGWRLGHDPRADFSTGFYRARYADIRKADLNPFLHYCRSGRLENRETCSYIHLLRPTFRPRVSVIVPNYNHAAFLRQRLASIAAQSYGNIELIVLDDNSTDDSRRVIRDLVAELDIPARLEFNGENSGNVFSQWRKGLDLASGDLIWICESDDFCEPDFLERIVPAFADESVNIAFGRIQFCEPDGTFREGLDGYREGAEAGIWQTTLTRPAAQWFNGALGVNNVIANVGGCVFRRVQLPDTVWDRARSFRICGDWFLYLHLAGTGQITFEPRAVSYFRQHAHNTSASNFHRRYYYDEHFRVLEAMIGHWGIAVATRRRFLDKLRAQFDRMDLEAELGPFERLCDLDALLAARRRVPHIQMHFLGFHLGGGEIFPINLANALLEAGLGVSMLAVDMLSRNEGMKEALDRRIPIYSGLDLSTRRRADFWEAAGVSLIHSHVAASDAQLANAGAEPIERPYVVTMHGSYVGLDEASAEIVEWILANVTGWVYLAERNLEFFAGRPPVAAPFVKLPNAMPADPRPAPFSRADLGIGAGDLVFTLVGRAVRQKGWRIAVEAFRRFAEGPGGPPAHLLMVGEGEAAEEARQAAKGQDNIHFLGYQKTVNAILRMSDCMLLPTRFEGESYPLCLIQALQEGLPSIATDIGEIRVMMTQKDDIAGILLDFETGDDRFIAALQRAMEAMRDPQTRRKGSETAKLCAERYDMRNLARSYMDIYERAIGRFAGPGTGPGRGGAGESG